MFLVFLADWTIPVLVSHATEATLPSLQRVAADVSAAALRAPFTSLVCACLLKEMGIVAVLASTTASASTANVFAVQDLLERTAKAQHRTHLESWLPTKQISMFTALWIVPAVRTASASSTCIASAIGNIARKIGLAFLFVLINFAEERQSAKALQGLAQFCAPVIASLRLSIFFFYFRSLLGLLFIESHRVVTVLRARCFATRLPRVCPAVWRV